MKELVEKVAALYADFSKDANAQIENGNKAAGTRARKASFEKNKHPPIIRVNKKNVASHSTGTDNAPRRINRTAWILFFTNL